MALKKIIRSQFLLVVGGFFFLSCSDGSHRDSVGKAPSTTQASDEARVAGEARVLNIDSDLLADSPSLSGTKKEQLAQLKELMQKQEEAMNNIFDRTDNLMKKLRRITAQGCMLDQPIAMLHIQVTGSELEDRVLEGNRRDDLYKVAENTKVTIELGASGSQKLTHDVNEIAGFFDASTSNSQLKTTKFKDFKIGDISYIRVMRPGFYIIRSEDKSETFSHGMWNNLNEAYQRWKFVETHRYHLKGLAISVDTGDGIIRPLYNRQNIDAKFHYPIAYFDDYSLTSRDLYLNLLRTESCSD